MIDTNSHFWASEMSPILVTVLAFMQQQFRFYMYESIRVPSFVKKGGVQIIGVYELLGTWVYELLGCTNYCDVQIIRVYKLLGYTNY